MWFSLIFKNLKLFIKNKPVLFVFIIITQIVCVISSLTVAGMIDAVTPNEQEELPYHQRAYNISFENYSNSDSDSIDLDNPDENILWYYIIYDEDTGKLLYSGTDDKKANVFLENRNIKTSGVTAQTPDNYKSMPKFSDIKERLNKVIDVCGDYLKFLTFDGYTDDTLTVQYSGYYPSQDLLLKRFPELAGDKKKISVEYNSKYDTIFKNSKEGDTVKINNTEYVIAKMEDPTKNGGTSQYSRPTGFAVLLPNVDDDFSVFNISFTLTDDVPQEVRGQVTDTVKKLFNQDAVGGIHEAEVQPLAEKQFNNMVYVVSFILIAVVLLNVARLYTYIMSKRQKTIAVCRLCGADKIKSFLLYITEIVITLIVTYIIGALIFRYGLIEPIALVFPTFKEFFTLQIYVNIFVAYFVIGIIIMSLNLIPLVHKTIVESKKGAK
ncbi:MAG: ABC transporter permease [Acutalibacteraceae bacterium]